MRTNGKEKAQAADLGGADIRAGYLTSPIVHQKNDGVNRADLIEARREVLAAADRGDYAEAAEWLDDVYYPLLRALLNGGNR